MPVLLHRFSALFIVSFGLAACGSSSRNIPVYDAASAESIQPAELFVSNHPSRPYVDKGVIEAQESFGESSDELLERMRWMAGRRGCDALIVLGSSNTITGSGGWVGTKKGFRGSCAVYTGAEPSEGAQVSALMCVPNATQACLGAGACPGAQACREDGRGYTPCDCGTPATTQPQAPAPAAEGASVAPASVQATPPGANGGGSQNTL
jgi:hypothetical protein